MAKPTVAITGITGFIGSITTKELLDDGYTVHGCALDTSAELTAPLTNLTHPGELNIFEADLNVAGSHDAALAGCTFAIHTAFPISPEDESSDSWKIAVQSTINFLRSCLATGVKKVVLLSSTTTIAHCGEHLKVFDESDWNTLSSPKSLPYQYAQTEAERAAWRFVDGEGSALKLVSVNASLALGPSMVNTMTASQIFCQSLGNGLFHGIIDVDMAVVDVRDLAKAMKLIMESETASGRYICSAGHNLHARDFTKIAKECGLTPAETDLSGPTVTKLIKLGSRAVPGYRGEYARALVGKSLALNNEKIVREIDMKFRDVRQSAKESFEDLIQRGQFGNVSGTKQGFFKRITKR